MKNIISVLLLSVFIPNAFPKCANIPEDFKPTAAKKLLKNRKLLGMVEQKFMSFMGLSEKPKNRTRKRQVHVPDHIWKLYNKWNRENEKMTEHADTARLLHSDDGEIPGRINFNLSSIPKKEKVHRAELLLFAEQQKRGDNLPHRHLRLYTPKFENGDLLLAFYKKIRNQRKGYVKLDITHLIKDWKVNGVENSSMIVEIDRKADDLNSVHARKRRHISEHEWERKRPMLVVYSSDEKNKRVKEQRRERREVPTDIYLKVVNIPSVNETHQKVKQEACRLRPYALDFKDFGWDEWIIAPNSYDLNFCSGACPKPLGPHFNTTNHAVIQNAVLGINKQLVPQLCCVPTTFKDQTFLFLDGDGKLMLKTPVEMIALGCGCH